jgi:hypothetical protein
LDEKGFLMVVRPGFSFSERRIARDEMIVLDLESDRELLDKLEQVLKVYELCAKTPYTPETYLAEIIEQEYAQLV